MKKQSLSFGKSGTQKESSTGALKTGPRKDDGMPKGKKPPVDRGEKGKRR